MVIEMISIRIHEEAVGFARIPDAIAISVFDLVGESIVIVVGVAGITLAVAIGISLVRVRGSWTGVQ